MLEDERKKEEDALKEKQDRIAQLKKELEEKRK